MKSIGLRLPIEYQQYPKYFSITDNARNKEAKNNVIQKILKKHNAKSVLDMACGTGAQVFYLTSLWYEVVGSDFSPALLEIARKKALKENLSIEFIDGDMRTLQVRSFDAVITIDNAIGHLVKSDI